MRILLAGNQPKVRSALRLLLEQEMGVQVVGEATEAKALLAQVAANGPDLVLLDWELPGTAEDLLVTLRQTCAELAVIVLSGQLEAEEIALAAGADAFVSKADPPEKLLAAVRSYRDR